MGRRGPRPLPVLPDGLDPEPASARRPRSLSWLSAEAKAEWRRVAPRLARLGLLTELDHPALAAYCEAYADWKAARQALAAKGRTYVTPSGALRARPEVTIEREAMRAMLRAAAEFGLTPSGRTALRDKTAPEALRDFARALDSWRRRVEVTQDGARRDLLANVEPKRGG